MLSKQVDKQDIEILKSLTMNARASLREIAAKTGMAVGTVQNRLAKLRQRGVLTGFKPVIEYNRLGYGVDAIIALNIRRDKHEDIIKLLEESPNIMSVYETTGEVDIFIRGVFRSGAELHDFLMYKLTDDLVKKSVTHTVMKVTRNDSLLDHL